MPETIAPSPATSPVFPGNSAGSAPSADGGRQALEMQWDFAPSRRAQARPVGPAKNARFANTPSPAVQHDGSSGGTAIRRLENLARGAPGGATQTPICPQP